MNSEWDGIDNIDGVIQTIIDDVSKVDKTFLSELKNMPKKDLISLHFTFGMGIRNHFGLWADNDLLKAECQAALEAEDDPEPDHPDSMSMLIIERLHAKLNGE